MSQASRKVTMIVGSLRKDSLNRKLMKLLQEEIPSHWSVEEVAIGELPFYNQDIEIDGDPEVVTHMKQVIQGADGVILITPEYNSGTPAVLKNALDWASRPTKTSVLIDKPFAVAGASPGGGGTAQSQAQVRQTLLTMNAVVMPGPKMLVSRAHEKVNEQTEQMDDERTRKHTKRFLDSFEAWMSKF
ncbi:NADPH-dependent FMN reductase [Geomicrobium sp. JCM 19039]|uniref:NADPH-dependent FMN reductase n=1 Tax=Geomicrobium sp. JCM 19039 TaxID=1460636 RepID=UPI00045F11E9|nr:NADPH-dependent FMN reductase [Geomicrobium sp. JCM 19039]GAK12141.1 NADPH-dependent FMN reductase [Geomicrobium sp. JCM 19039]